MRNLIVLTPFIHAKSGGYMRALRVFKGSELGCVLDPCSGVYPDCRNTARSSSEAFHALPQSQAPGQKLCVGVHLSWRRAWGRGGQRCRLLVLRTAYCWSAAEAGRSRPGPRAGRPVVKQHDISLFTHDSSASSAPIHTTSAARKRTL